MAKRILSHFQFISFQNSYWEMGVDDRKKIKAAILNSLQAELSRYDLLTTYPARTDSDFLVWSSRTVSAPEDTGAFFDCLSHAINPHRRWIRPETVLWGFTGPSSYARGNSSQAIDPLINQRKKYLVIYPFVKTVDWYRMGRDTRQGMMNEHIRIGHQYPEISQLLLYSTGLQDQEFVVVYEMDDLIQFSDLVVELRGSDARKFTERDTPIFTALYHPLEQALDFAG